jgi:hypothetical protein
MDLTALSKRVLQRVRLGNLKRIMHWDSRTRQHSAKQATRTEDHEKGQTRRADPSLLRDNNAVNFRIAEQYLGISERQRQKLVKKGTLEVVGGGQNRKITTESLRKYLPPQKTRTNPN